VKFSKTIYLVLPICFFAAALLSCNSKRKKEAAMKAHTAKPPAPKVDGFIVQTRTVSESIEVPGTLVAAESTEIHPEVSGRIVGLYIKEGAHVNKGALLAKLYDGDLQAQKRKLQVQLQQAEQTTDRYQQLAKIGGISKQDYETTALQVSNIRADLDITRTEIDKTEIRAPFSGKLGLKGVSVGAFVTPQTVVTTIQKTTGLRIDFNVPEKYVSEMKSGKYINFTIEGSGRNYTATVMATESGIAQATRSLTIRALVKGDATGLVPGGFAKVKINFDPNPNALLIPTQAVIPQARGKKVALYRNGKAEFVDVVTGVRDSAMVQVTSGLNKGDTVIITGLLSIKPDAKVALNKIASTVSQPAGTGGNDEDQ